MGGNGNRNVKKTENFHAKKPRKKFVKSRKQSPTKSRPDVLSPAFPQGKETLLLSPIYNYGENVDIYFIKKLFFKHKCKALLNEIQCNVHPVKLREKPSFCFKNYFQGQIPKLGQSIHQQRQTRIKDR